MNAKEIQYRNLMSRLTRAIQKESEVWTELCYSAADEEDHFTINRDERSHVVRWLSVVSNKLEFHPDTFFHGVSILDQFLSIVKADVRYLGCIAISCLFIAAKREEEDDNIPVTEDLIHISECGCSMAEVLRMEKCILNKFSWNIRTITALEFLQIFNVLLMEECPSLRLVGSRGMDCLYSYLEAVLFHSVSCHSLLQFPPSTVAFAALYSWLKTNCPHIASYSLHRFQSLLEVDPSSVHKCRKTLLLYYSQDSFASECLYRDTEHLGRELGIVEDLLASSVTFSSLAVCASGNKMDKEIEMEDLYDGISIMYDECEKILCY